MAWTILHNGQSPQPELSGPFQLTQPPKSFAYTMVYWNRYCPWCENHTLVYIPGSKHARVCRVAALQLLYKLHDHEHMYLIHCVPQPFDCPLVDIHIHTKTLWYKTTSRSDTTNPCRGRAGVVPHEAERRRTEALSSGLMWSNMVSSIHCRKNVPVCCGSEVLSYADKTNTCS